MAVVKIKGQIVAGWPSPAEEELVDSINLDDYLITNREATFLLKVNGDSMIEAGIMPGDLVLIEKGREIKSGDIVVAEIDSQWTLKRFMKKGGRIALWAANRNYGPIYPQEELILGGKVTAVVRKY